MCWKIEKVENSFAKASTDNKFKEKIFFNFELGQHENESFYKFVFSTIEKLCLFSCS